MSEEKKTTELWNEELEKVNGGLKFSSSETIQYVCPYCGYVLCECLSGESISIPSDGVYCPACKKRVNPIKREKQ